MTRIRYYSIGLIALDALAVVVIFNSVAALRGLAELGNPIVAALMLPVAVHMIAMHLIDGYSAKTDMLSLTYASMHAIALMAVLGWTFIFTYVLIPPGFTLQSSRIVTASTFLLLIPVSLSYRRFMYQALLNARGIRYLVFVGNRATFAEFRSECRAAKMGQKLLHASTDEEADQPPTVSSSPPVSRLDKILDEFGDRIEAVVIRESGNDLSPDMAQRLMGLHFSGISTYTLELFQQIYWRKIPLYRLNQTWLFQAGFQIAREPIFDRIKRLTDIVLASAGLALALPLLPIVAAAIWLEDQGSVFFTQQRVGKHRQHFRMFKLRSMRSAPTMGETSEGAQMRITRVGRFLRATRLDEMPQLWNVLCGDMSLIGPRAEWVPLVEQYERQIPCYHFRHLVKPGISGWAQVNYPYGMNVQDTLKKLEYDLYYIRYHSFVLDASIILKTIHTMLGGSGR